MNVDVYGWCKFNAFRKKRAHKLFSIYLSELIQIILRTGRFLVTYTHNSSTYAAIEDGLRFGCAADTCTGARYSARAAERCGHRSCAAVL